MNFTCLTQFTKITKINLNAVKHAHLRLRPTGEQPSSAPWTPKGGLAGGSKGGLAAGPPLEATAPTSGRELTSSSKGGCRLRAGVQDKGLLEKSDWLTTSGVLVVIIVQKHGMNFTCLTAFKLIFVNAVKHMVCKIRDCSKNATGLKQVMYLWQLSSKNLGRTLLV